MLLKAGRDLLKPLFVAGEPQEEALARIEYLKDHGGGWCELAGPLGIGKTMLLAELSRRAQQRGEHRGWIDLGPRDRLEWGSVLAEAWKIDVPAAALPLDFQHLIHDQLVGLRAMNRPAWLFLDQAEEFSEELARGCRWLSQWAMRLGSTLTIVMARRAEADVRESCEDADLRLELWPWEPHDCERYLQACATTREQPLTFSPEAIRTLCEQSAGIPKNLAKLMEWVRVAAEAESEEHIGPELVHAVAEELSPVAPRSSSYESSAGYGAW